MSPKIKIKWKNVLHSCIVQKNMTGSNRGDMVDHSTSFLIGILSSFTLPYGPIKEHNAMKNPSENPKLSEIVKDMSMAILEKKTI